MFISFLFCNDDCTTLKIIEDWKTVIMNNEFEGKWKETIIQYFKLISEFDNSDWHSLAKSRKNISKYPQF
jgi:hypothetical protein